MHSCGTRPIFSGSEPHPSRKVPTGDLLNTASRIQSCCNTFGKQILISENIKNALEATAQFESAFMGDVQLKGKIKKVKIYSVEQV